MESMFYHSGRTTQINLETGKKYIFIYRPEVVRPFDFSQELHDAIIADSVDIELNLQYEVDFNCEQFSC